MAMEKGKFGVLCSEAFFITVDSFSFKFQTVLFTSLCIIFVYNKALKSRVTLKKKKQLPNSGQLSSFHTGRKGGREGAKEKGTLMDSCG